jgi:hypothetical protein
MGLTQKRLETGFALFTAREEASGFGLPFRTVLRPGGIVSAFLAEPIRRGRPVALVSSRLGAFIVHLSRVLRSRERRISAFIAAGHLS